MPLTKQKLVLLVLLGRGGIRGGKHMLLLAARTEAPWSNWPSIAFGEWAKAPRAWHEFSQG